MKSEECNTSEKKSDDKKLDKKANIENFQGKRHSNIYSSLPNRGTSQSKTTQSSCGTNDGIATATNNSSATSNYCTGKRRDITKNKRKKSPIHHIHKTEPIVQTDQSPPYMNLNNDESFDEHQHQHHHLHYHDHSYGLSNDLSTESLRNACAHYDDDENVDDDLSDDDLIEIHHTPHCFQKSNILRRSLKQKTAQTIDRHRKRRKLDEHPLCTLPRNSSSIHARQLEGMSTPRSTVGNSQDEVIDVLNELDAILNDHAACSILDSSVQSGGSSATEECETRIEDCLMDLDNYLDGIDDDGSLINYDYDDQQLQSNDNDGINVRSAQGMRRNRTLPKNMRAFPTTHQHNRRVDENSNLERGHKLRKTISSDLKTDRLRTDANPTLSAPITSTTSGSVSKVPKEWRRNSMRKTSPLSFPIDSNDQNAEENLNTSPLVASENCSEAMQLESATTSTAYTSELPTISCSDEINGTINSQHYPAAALTVSISSLPNANEMLTTAHIFQNILLQSNESNAANQERPRQFGRRAQSGHSGLAAACQSCLLQNDTTNSQRPMSAPASNRQAAAVTATNTTIGSEETSSIGSSRNPSPISIISTSSDDSSSTTTLNARHDDEQLTMTTAAEISGSGTGTDVNAGNDPNMQDSNTPLDPDNVQLIMKPGNNTEWPHGFSRILALISCTLGLFNVCRFAIMTVQYGGNFLLQFLLLSVLFGIPAFWLQMCLGAKIKAGPVTMWKISPICKGIGISLVLLQCILTIYSSIGVAWVLIYLRDSFLNKGQMLYRWQEPYFSYRYRSNNTGNLTEAVADYFNGVVLQRLHMISSRSNTASAKFQVSDRLAFNVALIWTFVFLVLCKGLKSYGKAVLGLVVIPLVILFVVTCKFLTVIDFTTLQNIFSAADFEDFLVNSKTWAAAAQETFLTWALWGPSVIAITSRLHANASSKDVLRRDAILVVVITLFGLSLAALLGLACVQILNENYYIYIPGSYEHMDSYTSVYSLKAPINTALISFPPKWVPHYSSLLGETYRRPTVIPNQESGYQSLRFISELFPAALALCTQSVSWIWAAVAFTMFLILGLAQMCAMWKPISSALGNSTSSVLLSCVTGLLLSIPFATEMGITIVHYFDLLLGGAWFLPVIMMVQIFGVFLIRGRPYNGDDLVNDLRMSGSMSAFLALSWNVLLPIGLIALAIVEYKISHSNQFYNWRIKSYFSLWARKLAGFIQIGFMLIIPITAIIQIYRYLTKGPPDILDRIQLLYRPSEDILEGRTRTSDLSILNASNRNAQNNDNQTRNADSNARQRTDDAPPKYTPPPSYTTATGARLAKILRQSIRRSVRRIMNNSSRTRPVLDAANEQNLPPDYTALHMNENIEIGQCSSNPQQERALSLERNINLQKLNLFDANTQQQRPHSASQAAGERNLTTRVPSGRPYTAQDVATILRSSTRRQRRDPTTSSSTLSYTTTTADANRGRHSNDVDDNDDFNCSSYSAENLILNAEPPGESAAIAAAAHIEELYPIENIRHQIPSDDERNNRTMHL